MSSDLTNNKNINLMADDAKGRKYVDADIKFDFNNKYYIMPKDLADDAKLCKPCQSPFLLLAESIRFTILIFRQDGKEKDILTLRKPV